MPRPIPVFEFVLSAYAATCTGRAFQPDTEPVATTLTEIATVGALMASTAGLSADLTGLLVKVSVADGGAAAGPQALAPGVQPVGPSEDLWLSGIVETPSGFLGVVHFQPERLKNVREGESIAFRRRHVLEWKRFEPATLVSKHCEAALP
jgi:hypothetical protein